MTSNCQDSTTKRMKPGAIVGGAFLLVLGGTMLLDRTGLADISVRHIVGPAFLILLGMMMMFENGGVVFGRRQWQSDGTATMKVRKRGGTSGGLWLIGVGVWMLVSQLHIGGLDYHTSWPLLLVLSGAIMLVRGLR